MKTNRGKPTELKCTKWPFKFTETKKIISSVETANAVDCFISSLIFFFFCSVIRLYLSCPCFLVSNFHLCRHKFAICSLKKKSPLISVLFFIRFFVPLNIFFLYLFHRLNIASICMLAKPNEFAITNKMQIHVCSSLSLSTFRLFFYSLWVWMWRLVLCHSNINFSGALNTKANMMNRPQFGQSISQQGFFSTSRDSITPPCAGRTSHAHVSATASEMDLTRRNRRLKERGRLKAGEQPLLDSWTRSATRGSTGNTLAPNASTNHLSGATMAASMAGGCNGTDR